MERGKGKGESKINFNENADRQICLDVAIVARRWRRSKGITKPRSGERSYVPYIFVRSSSLLEPTSVSSALDTAA